MSVKNGYRVSAKKDGKASYIEVREVVVGVLLEASSIFDKPTLSPTEARELAHCLYVLAARVEKRLDQHSNATDAEAPSIPEGRNEARQGREAPPQPQERPDGEHLHEEARLAKREPEHGAAGLAAAHTAGA